MAIANPWSLTERAVIRRGHTGDTIRCFLMIDFYHNLAKRLPVFEAMRQAQLVMLRGQDVRVQATSVLLGTVPV